MSLARRLQPVSFEDYLASQRGEGQRFDFWDGTLVELEATTKNHNRIKRNLIAQIPQQVLENKGCELFDENVMTQIQSKKRYVYPDIVLTCNPEDQDPLIIVFPYVIIEILSQDTAQYDRTEKFFQYQRIPSVEQCVFIAQHQVAVESFERAPNGQWLMTPLAVASDKLIIHRLNHRIPLEQIYDRISF